VQDDGLDQGIATNLPGTAHPDILGRIAGIFNATSNPLRTRFTRVLAMDFIGTHPLWGLVVSVIDRPNQRQ